MSAFNQSTASASKPKLTVHSPATSPPQGAMTAPAGASFMHSKRSRERLFSDHVVMNQALPETPLDPVQLREQNRKLRAEVEALEAQLSYFQSPRIKARTGHQVRTSRLPSGIEVRISEPELLAMQQVFALFDRDGNGTISAADLQALHQKLGEPITDEEAREVVQDIGDGSQGITFEAFVQMWDNQHPSQRALQDTTPTGWSVDEQRARKRQWYAARFKFMKAKIANPVVGRIYTQADGVCPSLEYRVRFFYDDDSGKKVQISPWHDVPFRNPDGTFNMIVEIPKWTRRKFEIATGEPFNPIKQDVKHGILREYSYGDMLFNYGAIPQTWEDPKYINPATRVGGDNDPIDVVDIGTKQWTTGSIVRVKLLGVLAMIDAGETDWKCIGINVEDPLATMLHDIDDLYVHMPGAVEALHKWLKLYKSPAINEFAFEGRAQNRAFAEALVEETHEQWQALIEQRGGAATV